MKTSFGQFSTADVRIPFERLPAIEPARRDAIEAVALRVNQRYNGEFIEEFSFCPYARRGREKGQTRRYVHYADSGQVQPLVDLMHQIAADPTQIVAQVILPLVDVAPEEWRRFCSQLTDLGNTTLARDSHMVTAALHPGLRWSELNAFTLIPLFRRAPDPTIQWVRKAPLDDLYAGRGRGTGYVAPENINALLAAPLPPTPLYDRIALTNQAMARRLGVGHIERTLAEHRDDGRRSYTDILMDPGFDEEA